MMMHHYTILQFNFHIGFADTQRTSESDTDSSKTGIAFIKGTYTCYIYSGIEYLDLELPVKTPSPRPRTRHYRRSET